MEVLKLTVKREIFDNISDGKQDFVYLEANGYWIKRLAENKLANFNKLKTTQSFKKYDEIEITCLNDKINTTFDGIFTGDDDGVIGGDKATGIVVKLGKIIGVKLGKIIGDYKTFADKKDFLGDKAFSEETPSVAAEPNTDEFEEVDEIKGKDDVDDIDAESDVYEEEELADEIIDEDDSDDLEDEENDADDNYSFKELIEDFISSLDNFDNVYYVNRPNIIIANGRIFGTNQKLNINNEEEIKINIGRKIIEDSFGDDVKFLYAIEEYIYQYCASGYVFIWKDGCEIVEDENGRRLILRISKEVNLNR